MRLFIALDFPEMYFKELQDKLPDFKGTRPKVFHLTLKFLGEVEENKVDHIKDSLSKIKFEPLTVTINHLGFFPDEKYIKVVWAGVKEPEPVNTLQINIDNALEQLFKKDSRFHQHITLARVRYMANKETFVQKIKQIKVEKEFPVNNFKLIKSTLTPNGPVYEDIAVYNKS